MSMSIPAGIRVTPAAVDVVQRAEGYTEYRCVPASWSYDPAVEVAALKYELGSHERGGDPEGLGEGSQVWSGSDAALRLRSTPAHRLDLRELHVFATRRLLGPNAPGVWVARDLLWSKPETRRTWSRAGPMWAQFGMYEAQGAAAISGWGMNMVAADPEFPLPVFGARGHWYCWSTVRQWNRWPRRQEVERSGTTAEPGPLLLFVSHRWEHADHPDPTGRQLKTLTAGLTVALAAAVGLDHPEHHRSASGLPELFGRFLAARRGEDWRDDPDLQEWAKRVVSAAKRMKAPTDLISKIAPLETGRVASMLGSLRGDVLVWFDYASMHQAPRSPGDEVRFRSDLLEMNHIQAGASTLLLEPGPDYLTRAWCFLEFSGALRQQFVELRPQPDSSIRQAGNLVGWASKTDQLIAALATHGVEAIQYAGLRATDAGDLPVTAELLRQLPLSGAVESDDSDLVGGSLPYPRSRGGWFATRGSDERQPDRSTTFGRLPVPGRLPPVADLPALASSAGAADGLNGDVGIWCFATSRILSLAWAARGPEIWRFVRAGLVQRGLLPDQLIDGRPRTALACAWTDVRGLAEDGWGWTRAVPSGTRLLVVVTQGDVVRGCRIYQSIVDSQLEAGATVVTYQPFEGDAHIYFPEPGPVRQPTPGNVLARPRMRRDACRINQLFASPDLTLDSIRTTAALRLDPRAPMNAAILRSDVAHHPEWGYDAMHDPDELLQALSLDQVRLQAEMVSGPSNIAHRP